MSTEKRAFTLDELSEGNFGGKSFLHEQIRKGRLTATKLGRRTVVMREDLDRWIASLPKRGAQA